MVEEKQVKELAKAVKADLSKADPELGRFFGKHESQYKGNLQRMIVLAKAGDRAGYKTLFQVLARKVKEDYRKSQT